MNRINALILILIFGLQSCQTQTAKINGISFVASREPIDQNHIKPVINLNANYASIMPFGFSKNLEHPEIIYNTERQWFGETRAGAKQYIEELRKQSIKVMLKPQIWVWGGFFTGDIKMEGEKDWQKLEQSYTKFILEYADLAKELDVEIFCIGTELEEFIKNRPEFWEQLIKDVRKIYKGKLTYAANWDEYGRTPFWNKLDFIGIDAYFPVSDEKTPSVEHCKYGWLRHLSQMKKRSECIGKPILFTEYGYRSVDYSAKEPWRNDRDLNTLNMTAQKNAYVALFDVIWDKEWFAGGFLWKWFHDHGDAGGTDNTRFTPQNKPAEAIVRNFYKIFK